MRTIRACNAFYVENKLWQVVYGRMCVINSMEKRVHWTGKSLPQEKHQCTRTSGAFGRACGWVELTVMYRVVFFSCL